MMNDVSDHYLDADKWRPSALGVIGPTGFITAASYDPTRAYMPLRSEHLIAPELSPEVSHAVVAGSSWASIKEIKLANAFALSPPSPPRDDATRWVGVGAMKAGSWAVTCFLGNHPYDDDVCVVRQWEVSDPLTPESMKLGVFFTAVHSAAAIGYVGILGTFDPVGGLYRRWVTDWQYFRGLTDLATERGIRLTELLDNSVVGYPE